MALKSTLKKMEMLLSQLALNLAKAEKGNKAASQRVRTLSIQFAKVAKVYRKESMQINRTTRKQKKTPTRKKAPMKKSIKRKKTTQAKRKNTMKKRRRT
ncbi:MAG: histone [Chlamydiota bacterium]